MDAKRPDLLSESTVRGIPGSCLPATFPRRKQVNAPDPYRRIAGFYDALLEPVLRGLRRVSERQLPPLKNKRVLDIGCGTGSFLRRCARSGAVVFGIDRSPAMLAKARVKLDGAAGLSLGDAARMPFRERVFDLIAVSMALHEMDPATRSAVVAETRRLLAIGGQLLVVDYHPGPVHFPFGFILRLLGFCTEMLAGGEHFHNYREFIAGNGLAALVRAHRLRIVHQVPVWQGLIAVSVLVFTE